MRLCNSSYLIHMFTTLYLVQPSGLFDGFSDINASVVLLQNLLDEF